MKKARWTEPKWTKDLEEYGKSLVATNMSDKEIKQAIWAEAKRLAGGLGISKRDAGVVYRVIAQTLKARENHTHVVEHDDPRTSPWEL